MTDDARGANSRGGTITTKSLAEIAAIRTDWEELQSREPYPDINADIDRFVSVTKSMEEAKRPHVVLVRQDGRPKAMLIGRVGVESRRISIGYKTLLRPSLNCLSIVHAGVLGQEDEDSTRALLDEARAMLERREVEAVSFNHLACGSRMYEALKEIPGMVRGGSFSGAEAHWVMEVPESMDAFYKSQSGRTRQSLRYDSRLMEKEFPGQVEYVQYSGGEDLAAMLDDVTRILPKTYQHGMGVGFADSPGERARLEDAARLGWLKVHVLRAAGVPRAFEMTFEYRGTCFIWARGYDAELGRLSPGKALLLRVIEHLTNTRSVERVDFGLGDADYKRIFCKTHWTEANVDLFAPAFKPLAVKATRTLAGGLSGATKAVLARLGAARALKRRWRDGFRKSGAQAAKSTSGKDGAETRE